ncbi:MAG: type III-B CRISPR module RAMP protein Cmr6 [Verrucomicrobiia bacterium]
MIPMSPDVRALLGEHAEFVDNRSLLYEKFSLPKVWGHERKVDDAGRWSVLRIVTRGSDLLNGDAANLEHRARGRNVEPQNAARWQREAQLARKLAKLAKPDLSLVRAANNNAGHLLADLNRAHKGRIVTFEATLGGRLLINMAGGVIENAGICLDRCFGLPMIPGSAVKGIARSQALWEMKELPIAERQKLLPLAMAIFGYGKMDIARNGAWAWVAGEDAARAVAVSRKADDFKGCACFLPAYPTSAPTLVVDMVNPHYPEYYRGKRSHATDDENPIQNYFPAVEAGCAFGFAVLLNRLPQLEDVGASAVLHQAKAWLERAIMQKGAGAKTAAGYGWFRLGAPVPEPAGSASAPAKASPASQAVTDAVNNTTLKNHLTALMNPGSREGRLATLKADLDRDSTAGKRLSTLLAQQGKDGRKAIEWLKAKGIALT